MGLINWFKDKVILQMEYEIKSLHGSIKSLELSIEALQRQILSLRNYRARHIQMSKREEIEPEDLTPEQQRFINSLPEYERARLNNLGNNQE